MHLELHTTDVPDTDVQCCVLGVIGSTEGSQVVHQGQQGLSLLDAAACSTLEQIFQHLQGLCVCVCTRILASIRNN